MNITLNTTSPTNGDLIIPIVKTDALADQLTKLAANVSIPVTVLQRDFKAEAKEMLALYRPDGTKIYLLGIGEKPEVIDWLKTFRKFFFDQKAKLSAQLGIDLTGFDGSVAEAVVLGVRGGGYNLNLYHTDKPDEAGFLFGCWRVDNLCSLKISELLLKCRVESG